MSMMCWRTSRRVGPTSALLADSASPRKLSAAACRASSPSCACPTRAPGITGSSPSSPTSKPGSQGPAGLVPCRAARSGGALLQDVHGAGAAEADDVGESDLGAVDLAVACL